MYATNNNFIFINFHLDENDRSSESSDFYHHSDRTRSLSADSTRNNNDYDRIDKYHSYYEDDSRHNASRHHSYLEAVKQAGGSVDGMCNFNRIHFFFLYILKQN